MDTDITLEQAHALSTALVIVSLVAAGLLILVLGTALYKAHEVVEEEVTECEVGVVNPDGSITFTENSAGVYNYTIYATSDGFKVLGECN